LVFVFILHLHVAYLWYVFYFRVLHIIPFYCPLLESYADLAVKLCLLFKLHSVMYVPMSNKLLS